MSRHLFVQTPDLADPSQFIYDDYFRNVKPDDDDITSMKRRGVAEASGSAAHDHGKGDRTDAEVDITTNPSPNDPSPPKDGLVLGGGQTIKLMLVPDKAPSPAPPAKKEKPHPQTKMKKFWKNFDPEYTGKVTQVLPDRITDRDLSAVTLVGEIAHRAVKSYEDAKESCIRDVKRIIKECRASNQKYTDSHWDIERDLKITRARDCLDGLVMDDVDKEHPADAKRVTVSV